LLGYVPPERAPQKAYLEQERREALMEQVNSVLLGEPLPVSSRFCFLLSLASPYLSSAYETSTDLSNDHSPLSLSLPLCYFPLSVHSGHPPQPLLETLARQTTIIWERLAQHNIDPIPPWTRQHGVQWEKLAVVSHPSFPYLQYDH
jgi:hypothetical protein